MNENQTPITAEELEWMTDELSEAIADFESKIGPDEKAAYDTMAKHILDVQIALLEHLKKADQ
jgi:hypothetical protein